MFSREQLLKGLFDGLDQVQHRAQERFDAVEGDARRLFSELVERGRSSQRELEGRLAHSRPLQQSAVAFAGGLRRVADRVEQFAHERQEQGV